MAGKYDELKKQIESKSSDPADYLPRVLEEIKNDVSGDFIDACKNALSRGMMDAVKATAPFHKKFKHEKIMVEICIECMKRKKQDYYKQAKEIFQEKTVVKWKGHEKDIDEMTRILEEPIKWEPDDRERKRREKHVSWGNAGGALLGAVEQMIKACSRDKIIKKVAPSFARLLSSSIESGSDMHIVVALGIVRTSEISFAGSEKLIPDVLEKFLKWLRRDDIDLEENRDHKSLVEYIMNHPILEHAEKSSVPHLKSLMEYCLEQELDGDQTPLSIHGGIIRNILNYFVRQKTDKVKLIQDLIPCVVKLLTCDVEDLETSAGYVIGLLYQNGELLAPYGDEIVEAFLDNRCDGTSVGMALKSIFKYKPEVILSRIDRIAEKMEDMANNDKTCLYMLLDDVSKKNAEVLVPYIDIMFEDVFTNNVAVTCFMTLANISVKHAEHFVKHTERCLQAWEENPYIVTSVTKTIANVGRLSKKEAAKCLKILFGKLEGSDPVWIGVILMDIKRIGLAQKECLAAYRPQIEKLKLCQEMGVPDLVQSVIDFLDDRSLQGLSEEVAEQREDIDNLDSRVTNTENDIVRIDETVAQQGDEIQNVKNEVTEQGERLDDLKEVVNETMEKVEEIDHKTITNAPKWSRDVSKLLNPEHEHDWRFLAVRLGYSGEDIRNWALSPDPTMAILAEWYTTHKSSDATYAIFSALEDMGRTDAAEIIKQSLEEAELLVPQAPPDQAEKPPTIFLSYQWDHQPEVKAIRKHLEMAGFPCWVDIGQMGGGDQLFAKISQGMRSSKVVLCMVTEKYSSSENCNKEVNLANLLNKPIIPILIDHTQWPPEGAMSMLFAQLLYIQFYNDKEYVRGEKFWEDAKFSELLGQISYHANPDESMISDEYRDWIPEVEDQPVTVKKISSEAKSSTAQQDSTEHPSVFISYQWGKQPEIKKLFSRLTGLGYHCWLDINQMGGGDPLYSKIDKGVRNAKVVVSCVTPKYALSANCRREVSLSDALRKPIIPLLLEQMTWPPEGPMSMTFTQLLYIDFAKETTQANFHDEKFDELIEKIKEHAQPTLQIAPAAEQDDVKAASQGQSPTPTLEPEGVAETDETKGVHIKSYGEVNEDSIKLVKKPPGTVERSTTREGQPSPEDATPEESASLEVSIESHDTQGPRASSEEQYIAEAPAVPENQQRKGTPEAKAAEEEQTTPVVQDEVPEQQDSSAVATETTPTILTFRQSPEKMGDRALDPSSLPPSANKNKKSSTCILL